MWALLRHKVPMGVSKSANTPELILPCWPTNKPGIRSDSGSKIIECILLELFLDFSIGVEAAKLAY